VFGACEVRATVVTASSPSQVAWTSRGISHVFFDDATALKTEAYFPVAGTYTLVCTATDGTGSSSAEMTVNVAEVGSKPIPDIAYYSVKGKSKAAYGESVYSKNIYLYFTDYFNGSVGFDDVFKTGYFDGTYAISSSATDYFWQMQKSSGGAFALSGIGGEPAALTFAAWINGDLRTDDPDREILLAFQTSGAYVSLERGDGDAYPYDADGKRYVRVWTTDASFGTWSWQTESAICPTSGWNHIAVVMDRSASDAAPKVFLGGVEQPVAVLSTAKNKTLRSIAGSTIMFASSKSGASCFGSYGGRMSDIRLYGWELGESDLQTLALADGAKSFAPYVEVVGDSECGPGRELALGVTAVETYPADAVCSLQWSVVGGDATKVTIGTPTAAQPKVVISALGDYVLRLVATAGGKSTTIDHPVHVTYSFLSNAGADQVVTGSSTWLSGETVYPNATATDYVVTSAWRQVSGPVAEIESPETPLSAVSLSGEGVYRFELTAVSTLGTYCSTVTVTRVASAPGNLPPVLETKVTASNGCVRGSAQLTASAVDPDQSPSAHVRIRWFRLSGPGGVFFDNAVASETGVKFTCVGNYVIGCEASDGDLAVTNSIPLTVEVLGDKQDPDLFLYPLKSSNLQSQYDARGRTYLWPYNKPISDAGYFAGTYGLSCPTPSSAVSPINMPTVPNPEALAFAAWINMDTMTNANGRLIGILNAFYAGVQKDASSDRYRLYVGLGNGMSESCTWQSEYVLPATGWHHFAAEAVTGSDGNGVGKLWLDGVPLELTAPASSVPVRLGTYIYLGNRYNTVAAGNMAFSGMMSDIRFYAHELGDIDIQKLQNEKDFENRAPEIYKTAVWPAKLERKTWYQLPYEAFDDGLPTSGTFSATWAVTAGDASKVVFGKCDGGDAVATVMPDVATASSPSLQVDATEVDRIKFLTGGVYELTYTVTDGQYVLVRRVTQEVRSIGLAVIVR